MGTWELAGGSEQTGGPEEKLYLNYMKMQLSMRALIPFCC